MCVYTGAMETPKARTIDGRKVTSGRYQGVSLLPQYRTYPILMNPHILRIQRSKAPELARWD